MPHGVAPLRLQSAPMAMGGLEVLTGMEPGHLSGFLSRALTRNQALQPTEDEFEAELEFMPKVVAGLHDVL